MEAVKMAKQKSSSRLTAQEILSHVDQLPPAERAALLVLVNDRLGSQLRSVVRIAPDRIQPDEQNPRKRFDETKLRSLGYSMKQFRQFEPIQVRPAQTVGDFILISGERRWRAAKQVGLKYLDAIVEDLGGNDAVLAMVVSNLEREKLTAIEEARCCALLTKLPRDGGAGMTQDAAAAAMGFAKGASVSQRLTLLKLPPEWQQAIESGFNWTFARDCIVPHKDDTTLLRRAIAAYNSNPEGWKSRAKVEAQMTRLVNGDQPSDGDDAHDQPLTQVQGDIVAIIRDAGQRLTTAQVLESLSARLGDGCPSDSTVKASLAELIRRSVLSNRKDEKPPGYGRGTNFTQARV
jgi:ParB/RepB/Spo0J family partition protein